MYHFEGQFRSVPSQDHRGLSQRAQRNHVLDHAVTERHRRETKRTQEKNALIIQTWLRRLKAQRKLCSLATAELEKIDVALQGAHNRHEIGALLLRYLRIVVVAFVDSAHRDVVVLVKAAKIIEARKRMILEFREANSAAWNHVLASFLVGALKAAKYVSADYKWTFDLSVAEDLSVLINIIRDFSSPSPMSLAVSSVPESLYSWLSFAALTINALLPCGYFEFLLNLFIREREVDQRVKSFSGMTWDLLCGPLFLLTHDPVVLGRNVVTASLRSAIMCYFGAEVLSRPKADVELADCTPERIRDRFARGSAHEVPATFLESLYREWNSIFTVVAYQSSCVRAWEDRTLSFIEGVSLIAPHFVDAPRSGYWLLKCVFLMTNVESSEDPKETWEYWRVQPAPVSTLISPFPGMKKRKLRRSWRKDVSPRESKRARSGSNSSEDSAEDMDVGSVDDRESADFMSVEARPRSWSRRQVRVATALRQLFTCEAVVEKVLSDINLWSGDEECVVAFSWVFYELMELYSARMCPLNAMKLFRLYDRASTIPSILEKLLDLAMFMKRIDDGSILTGSRHVRTSIWDAVKHGSPINREETVRFVPVLICAGALNAYRLRTLTVLDVPEDPIADNGATEAMSRFLRERFVEMVYAFSFLSVGIIKILYPSNSVASGWARRISRRGASRDFEYHPALSRTVQRAWSWGYRAAVAVVRSAFDDGWRLGLVQRSSFWITMGQDEQLPFRSMSFDPTTFHQISFYTDGAQRQQENDEDPYVETRFDFMAAYFPRPYDVFGTGGTSVALDASAFTTLLNVPFVIPFIDRVQAFMALIAHDKHVTQGEAAAFGIDNVIDIAARRDRLYDDAFLVLSRIDTIRRKFRVSLWNEAGAPEAGIDGGGVFREFLTELLKQAVNPNRGLFQYTAHNTLFPNPTAAMSVDYCREQFFFVGRMLGKAVYENLLVDLAFAPFFLAQLLAVPYVPQLEDLRDLDPILHKNLVTVLETTDPAEMDDLSLDFSIVDNNVGVTKIVGIGDAETQRTPVTVQNRTEYIKAYVNYKLVEEIDYPIKCLKEGFHEIIQPSWLSLFRSPLELQLVLCGDQGPVDLVDLEKNTVYSGGYVADHPTIRIFWEVVSRFKIEDRQLLLKFVTSCSRPPVLGFSELNPKFCIHHGGAEDRLPTASTCMNLLKLPEYATADAMKEKLLYAINSASGFELS